MARPKIEITEELCQKAETLAAQGLIMEQIAAALGMGETTLYEKQAQYTKFSEAIKDGRAKGIAKVTNTLFKKATEDKDNTCMIFYLKNRAGWVDKSEHDLNANFTVNLGNKDADTL